jgi:hypothetical protein
VNKSYSYITSNQTGQNYTATAITYTISGNAGIAGATLSWTDGIAKTATADVNGNYLITVSYNFTGAVTPSLVGYRFTPASKSYTNVLTNQTGQSYIATAITYTISGNTGVAEATLNWTDGTARTATKDSSGNYLINVSYNFSGTTQIRIALPKESRVNITIYNVLGSVVEKLYEGELNAGYHEIQFNAGRLSSGIYIYRMTAGTYSQVLKMVLLK